MMVYVRQNIHVLLELKSQLIFMYQVVMLLLRDKLVSSDANNHLLVLVLQLWLNLVQFFFIVIQTPFVVFMLVPSGCHTHMRVLFFQAVIGTQVTMLILHSCALWEVYLCHWIDETFK